MKTVVLVGLAFVAGVHGFALFVPYLTLFFAAAIAMRRRPNRSIATVHRNRTGAPARAQAATTPTFEM